MLHGPLSTCHNGHGRSHSKLLECITLWACTASHPVRHFVYQWWFRRAWYLDGVRFLFLYKYSLGSVLHLIVTAPLGEERNFGVSVADPSYLVTFGPRGLWSSMRHFDYCGVWRRLRFRSQWFWWSYSVCRMHAMRLSRSRPSCLRSTSFFPQRVFSLWTTHPYLDHMRKLNDITLFGRTGHFDNEIDFAGSGGSNISRHSVGVLGTGFAGISLVPGSPGKKSTLRAQLHVPGFLRTGFPR